MKQTQAEVRNPSIDFSQILKQAERRVHQAPTLPGYRHPFIKGWKELATTSREKIMRMASDGYAGCNWVSVARNEFACMVDVDDLESAAAMGMPVPWDTFIVDTPSGSIHIYLWHTKRKSRRTVLRLHALTCSCLPSSAVRRYRLGLA